MQKTPGGYVRQGSSGGSAASRGDGYDGTSYQKKS